MPICPRCGKCLSSEQALEYHLNKKYKCGTWKCMNCSVFCDTKFQLQMHEMKCYNDRKETPGYDVLREFYLKSNIVVFQIDNSIIQMVSPSISKYLGIDEKYVIGKNIDDDVINITESDIARKKIDNTLIHFQRYTINDTLIYEIPVSGN